jgi:Leucine-rich repeat (LRR) protein
LSLEYNHIGSSSTVANFTSPRDLDLGSKQISGIAPLVDLANLMNLDVSNNRISDVNPLMENQGLSA